MSTAAVESKGIPLLPIDLVVYNRRLIGTRLAAAAAVWAGTFISTKLLGYTLPQGMLYGLGAWVLGYDLILGLASGSMNETSPNLTRLRRLIAFQIGLDALSLLFFVHLTGGISSPGLIFFGLHVIMVTILVPGMVPYVYVAGISTALLLVGILERSGAILHFPIQPEVGDGYSHASLLLAQVAFFAIGMGATVLITASIVAPLHTRERHLKALYETTLATSSSLEINTVVRGLAESTLKALDARAVTVHLLELDGDSLTRAASAGEESAGLGQTRRSASPPYDRALHGESLVLSALEALQIGGGRLGQALIVPILGQRSLGVMSIFGPAPASQEAPYTLHLATAFAAQSAKAIEHALAHYALQEAERQRTQFAHVLTHELRAPVTGAQSLLRLLLGNFVGSLTNEQQDILQRTSRRIDSLLILINDLLSLSAARARDFQEPLQEIHLTPLVMAAIERVQASAQEKRHTLESDYPLRDLVVLAHTEGLNRILDNLIGNAVKYTPNNGRVEVKLETDSARTEARLMIRDTGIGIPPEALTRLGEEFYRAPNAKESGIVGTGLGLTAVKQMIDHFKGRLEVGSQVGVGTTFTVILPLAKPVPSPLTEASKA